MEPQIETGSLFDIAAAFVQHTNRHLFLTGKAGTGKTTFLKLIKERTGKKTAIVAPTGVAAINAGGVTAHALFQLPFGPFLPQRQRGFSNSPATGTDLNTLLHNVRFNKEKRQLLEELELLVIDEVSMLRADMLDAIDGVLRHFRKNAATPFGGVQVLFIGDLYQLPPVVKDEDWSVLSPYYKSMFFFDALVMQQAPPLIIELDKIYRQSDAQFIGLLNNIRNNTVSGDDLELLNKYHDPYFYPEADDGYIILSSHNYKADKINQGALARLQGEPYEYEAQLQGDFSEHALPAERKLVLKAGAQIMFIRNDKGDQRRYYNGKIGIINRITEEEIFVRFQGEPGELLVEKEVWRNIRYNYSEQEDRVTEEELGSFSQYPIRLAWAVTIHKSQGLTFEKAIIDAGQSFAAGQVYVALSRLTSLKGLVLSTPITPAAIQTEQRITAFVQSAMSADRLRDELRVAQLEYMALRLLAAYDWEKLAVAFRDHNSEYPHIRVPHQEESVQWSAGMMKSVIALKEVGEKFCVQLRQLLANAEMDGFVSANQRVQAASAYFLKEMDEKLIAPWQAHYNATSVKAKVKKYVRTLKGLHLLLMRKRYEIEQTAVLTQGLAEGKSVNSLLTQLQSAPAITPPVAAAQSKDEPKEDSKSISLRMLREGKAIDTIASERGLARSTVEGHLVQLIPSGEVTLRDLVSEQDEAIITEAINASEDKTATAIRIKLNNQYSYGIIRAVLISLLKEN